MGNRSDVAISMYTKDYNSMIQKAKTLNNQDIYNFIKDSEKYIARNGEVTIIEWWDVKWDQGFEEVYWVENFVKNIDCVFVENDEGDDSREEVYGEGYELSEYACVVKKIEINGVRQPNY